MNIAVFGTGYVGLVSALCFAESKNKVIAVDLDAKRISMLQAGKSPIYESGLPELLNKRLRQGTISFTTNAQKAIASSQVLFIAVGTPSLPGGATDLSQILEVASVIGRYLKGYAVVVNKSTVPVGTSLLVGKRIAQELAIRNSKLEYDIVSNPEFLQEGSAIANFFHPDRVVLGAASPKALKIMQELYYPFVKSDKDIISMNHSSAELVKYAANVFLATKISFINEIAALANKVGADIDHVKHALGKDERIGKHFLNAGIGYGGSCLPKDINSLINTAQEQGLDFKLFKEVAATNLRQRVDFVANVIAKLTVTDRKTPSKIAVWGLSFKPGTDDIREAPAIEIIEQFLAQGFQVAVCDPAATANAKDILGARVVFYDEPYECLQEADALCLLTEWPEYADPDFARIKRMLKKPFIFDGRNFYLRQQVESFGLEYFGIGRS